MNFITISKEDVNSIKGFYGNEKKINVSEILKNILNLNIKKKKYFIIIKVNNITFKKDPDINKQKKLYLKINDKSYEFKEQTILYFNLKFTFNLVLKHNFDSLNFNQYNYATIFGK